ncbi:MAG: HsdM family class I SAM-dependent methyltransferase [Armatimonadota bacterium]
MLVGLRLHGYTGRVDSIRVQPRRAEPPEEAYAASAPIAHRKRLGQFFTPPAIARFMVRWAVQPDAKLFLDPAVGAGVFLEEAAHLLPPSALMVGWEIDPALAKIARARLGELHPACKICVGDFLLHHPPNHGYDAVVCNPPYVRHRTLRYPEAAWRRFDMWAGRKLSRFTNAYGLFLVAIAHALSLRGRAAVIIPSEFLNADFAVPIKASLLSQNILDAVLVFDHRDLVFGDAVTTACILLLRADRSPEEPVSLVTADRAERPDELELALTRRAIRVAPSALDPMKKWEPLVHQRVPSAVDGLVPLGSLAHCSRGIATGANLYFTLSGPEVEKLGLVEHVRPCVTKTFHASKPVFTDREFANLASSGRKAFLFWPTDAGHSGVLAYLKLGEKLGIPRRYLPSHRNPWYMPERRDPAPIWIAAFGRGRIRLVLNWAGVHNLTAFHGLYPQGLTEAQTNALFAFLCSAHGQAALLTELRRYGRGLLKLEPRDVERVLVPDLRAVPESVLEKLNDLVKRMALGEDVLAEVDDAIGRWLGRMNGVCL